MLCSHAFMRQCRPYQYVRLASSFASTSLRPQIQPSGKTIHVTTAQRSIISAIVDFLSGEERKPKRQRSSSASKSTTRRRSRAADAEPLVVKEGPRRVRKKSQESSTDGAATQKSPKKAPKTLKSKVPVTKLPSRLRSPTTPKHNDLKSFREHSERIGSRTDSTIYRGTHYEYIVQETLKSVGFNLERTGRTNDQGIDLQGTWKLPKEPEIRVLIQCKLSKPGPAMIRELHYRGGAPSGWKTNTTMSFLVSAKPATAGVMNGLDTSDLPMCFMEISEDGILKSFQSNKLAKEMYLTGLETRRYQISDKKGGDDRTYLVLFWQKRKLQQ